MEDIRLGDKVKCIYTGFVGIATARTEFINRCIQFSVVPKWDGKAPMVEEMAFDESSLKIIKKGKLHDDDDEYDNGGPMRRAPRMRGA